MALLKMNNLTTGYRLKRGETKAITSDISQAVAEGELICLLGVNGAGKSTLIRTLCGFQSPLSGQVVLGENHISQLSANAIAQTVSVVLTERPRVGAMTVYSMISLGRHPYTSWAGKLSDNDDVIIRRAASDTGAEPLLHRYVTELSDGEFQKVMIARALAQEPSLMILDEPTAFLDLPRSVELMRMLKLFAHDHGKAVICATHDISQALETADTLWIIDESGHLHSGAPEDMVLDGTLQRVFDTKDVYFDTSAGTFKMHHPPCIYVDLKGAGEAYDWTVRALERVGCAVAEDADIQIEIPDEGRQRWTLSNKGTTEEFETVGAVIGYLRHLLSKKYSGHGK